MARKAGLDRAQVLQAAAAIVDARGMDALTLNAVSAALNVRTPSLYNYVDGLPGLRRELALAATREQGERMLRAAAGKSSDEAVLAVAGAFRGYIKEHPGLYALTVPASRLDEKPDLEMQAAEDEVVSVMLAALRSYGLEGSEAVHAVRVFRSAVHGFATLEMAGGFGLPLDCDESFARLVQTLVLGLHAASGGSNTKMR